MSEKNRILIADDKDTFLESITENLKRNGFVVNGVSDSRQLFRTLKRGFDPHVVICDWSIPRGYGDVENFSFGESGGLAVFQEIRQIEKMNFVRLMFISGMDPFSGLLNQLSELNVWAYLEKPIVLSHVPAILQALRKGLMTPDEIGQRTKYFTCKNQES